MRALLIFAVVLGIFFLGCVGTQCGSEIQYVCGVDRVTYQNPCYAAQAGATVAYDGECTQNATPPTCYDSDNGKNLLEQGTTQIRGGASPGQPYTDFCIGTTGVQEYFCENNELRLESMSCPAGTVCENGLCTTTVCTDSDNGYNASVKGTTIKGSEVHTDACNGTTKVIEYACSSTNEILSGTLECASGETCVDGACVTLERCSDTDVGYDIRNKGTVTTGSGAYTDYCIDTGTVREYSCAGTALVESSTSCGTGYMCSDGACVAEVCADSDGGRVKDVFGRVTKGTSSWADYCYDETTVNEYYCDGSMVASTTLTCDGSDVCVSGECRAPTCTDSDGGNVPTVAGTATVASSSYSDSCTNLTRLREYYCSGSAATSANIDCYTYFGTAYKGVCWNNICTQTYCSDSDGGEIATVQGSARMYTSNGYDTGWNNDVCIDSRSLNEWYCDGNWRANTTLTCGIEQVCTGGRCADATCTDTDGGISYLTAGNVTKGLRNETDTCISSTVLREWYCAGNMVRSTDYTCPGGCFIATGRCSPL